VRFTYLFNQAMALDANYLATGHYARVVQTAVTTYQLHQAIDANKDQSYVLHVLTPEHLAHVKFPVGDYTKDEVRQLARKFNLPVASKSESQDLCFLGDGDYRRFLQEHSARVSVPGPIMDNNGRQLGQHNGLAFYTIGQRKGLGISTPEPVFVLKKDSAQNALIVGTKEELGQHALFARDVNWLDGHTPTTPIRAQVKIRYKAQALAAMVEGVENGRVRIQFDDPVFGITPGQGAVFYDGDICLGGGIITDDSTHLTPTLTLTDIPIRSS
jgi:tRNA-specific 2-thiouridylase